MAPDVYHKNLYKPLLLIKGDKLICHLQQYFSYLFGHGRFSKCHIFTNIKHVLCFMYVYFEKCIMSQYDNFGLKRGLVIWFTTRHIIIYIQLNSVKPLIFLYPKKCRSGIVTFSSQFYCESLQNNGKEHISLKLSEKEVTNTNGGFNGNIPTNMQ